jgi:hypothetical protein
MRGIYAVLLTILILTSTILPLVDAADTVTAGDDVMSGIEVLDGNYTVSAGDTLTIAAGTTLDAKDYWSLQMLHFSHRLQVQVRTALLPGFGME